MTTVEASGYFEVDEKLQDFLVSATDEQNGDGYDDATCLEYRKSVKKYLVPAKGNKPHPKIVETVLGTLFTLANTASRLGFKSTQLTHPADIQTTMYENLSFINAMINVSQRVKTVEEEKKEVSASQLFSRALHLILADSPFGSLLDDVKCWWSAKTVVNHIYTRNPDAPDVYATWNYWGEQHIKMREALNKDPNADLTPFRNFTTFGASEFSERVAVTNDDNSNSFVKTMAQSVPAFSGDVLKHYRDYIAYCEHIMSVIGRGLFMCARSVDPEERSKTGEKFSKFTGALTTHYLARLRIATEKPKGMLAEELNAQMQMSEREILHLVQADKSAVLPFMPGYEHINADPNATVDTFFNLPFPPEGFGYNVTTVPMNVYIGTLPIKYSEYSAALSTITASTQILFFEGTAGVTLFSFTDTNIGLLNAAGDLLNARNQAFGRVKDALTKAGMLPEDKSDLDRQTSELAQDVAQSSLSD